MKEEQAKTDETAKKVLDEEKLLVAKLYGMCATPIVGIIALVLVMKRLALISNLLFMVAGIGPYLIAPVPEIFLFCGWFAVAGLFALLSGGGGGATAE